MAHSSIDTVVLIFASNASTDAVGKKMVAASALFEELTAQTIKTVRAAGLPYVIHGDNEQHGESFGERLQYSINECFEHGYKNVIAIGNDTPQLHKNHLIKALENLKEGKLTMGPSVDGGFYLLAVNDLAFAKATSHNNCNGSFSNLEWQSNSLLVGLISLLSACSFNAYLLESLLDIDSLNDAKRLSNFHKTLSASILRLLSQLQQSNPTRITVSSFIAYNDTRCLFNKGSPLAA